MTDKSPVDLAVDLRRTVLLDPAKDGKADSLIIVSGYASPSYAKNHLDSLILQYSHKIRVTLLIGMRSNLDWAKREEYLDLEEIYEDRFKVFYVNEGPEVHSKLFAWFSGENPVVGFSGSANYTLNGFPFDEGTCKQLNHISLADPNLIRTYFNDLPKIAVIDVPMERPSLQRTAENNEELKPGGFRWLNEEKSRVRISLLRQRGDLPSRSGLNWEIPTGADRRPFVEDKSERWKYDAAYLKVPVGLHRENPNFFPERDSLLTLLTDDNEIFYCKIQQADRKAISTTNEKSKNQGRLGNRLLGTYLRKRIGVVFGDAHPQQGYAITKNDLLRYGRTDYTIEKISDESYFFDFSV